MVSPSVSFNSLACQNFGIDCHNFGQDYRAVTFTSKQSQLGPLKLRAISLPRLTGCDTTSKGFSGMAIQRPGMYLSDGGIVVVVSDGGVVIFCGGLGQLHIFGRRT